MLIIFFGSGNTPPSNGHVLPALIPRFLKAFLLPKQGVRAW